ncbi:MAG: peptidoglycan recognition family protein [Elusimicrobiota bacterium]
MRIDRGTSAAAALLFLGLAGCSGAPEDSAVGPRGMAAPSPDRSGDLRSFASAGGAISDLRDAPAGSPFSNVEAAAQNTRAFFDGDNRVLGSAAAGSVTASPGPWGGRREKLPLQASPRRKISGQEPPSPSGADLPKVDLPNPVPGHGPKGGGPTLLAYDAFQAKMFSMVYPLLSRIGWGAAKRRGENTAHDPYRVTVHHTQGRMTTNEADTIAQVRTTQRYHMVGRGREGKENFDDIGYHFLIDGTGRVIEGRHVEYLAAHAGGANEGNIGIALMGDFNVQKPTAAQIDSLSRLVSYLAIKYRKDPSRKGFLEAHQHYTSTDCPGKNVMRILGDLRNDVDADTDKLVARLRGGVQMAGAGFQPSSVSQTP